MGDLATIHQAGELAAVTYTREQVDLIKRSICVDATDDELQLFLTRCAKTGLDPFLRQIYSIKRKGKHTIQVGIDGYRLIAQRTGESDGQDGPHWCGPDGVWRDVWLERGPPAACRVTVFRRGQARGYTGTALWAEYGVGTSNEMYARMPAAMLAKVAESVALRKAFPQELSGMYVEEEMAQADAGPPPAQPTVSKEQFGTILAAKGWTWERSLTAIDHNRGTAFVAAKARFDQVPAAVLSDFAAWLREQPDKTAAAPRVAHPVEAETVEAEEQPDKPAAAGAK